MNLAREDLEELISEGRRPVEIAAELDCPMWAVYHYLHKYGIEWDRWRSRYPKLANDEWLRSEAKKRTTEEIASEIGCTGARVRARLRELGVRAKRRPSGGGIRPAKAYWPGH